MKRLFLSFLRMQESSLSSYLEILWIPVFTGMTTFYEFMKLKFSTSLPLPLTLRTGIGDSSRLTKEFNQMIAMRTRFPAPSVETRGPSAMGFFPYLVLKKSTHSTPRSEARCMLRVDTERRFYPDLKIGVWRRRTYQHAI